MPAYCAHSCPCTSILHDVSDQFCKDRWVHRAGVPDAGCRVGVPILQHACLSPAGDRQHLHKQVSRADDLLGRKWSHLPESLRIYAIADIKHGWLIWCVTVGCMLRDMFPDPDSVLFLTRVTQREFMAEFNALLQESFVGTEIQTEGLKTARTREAIARGIRYRRKNATLAVKPPGRVMILMYLLSPWVNITYGGCRYLREARVETLRKY